jgi:hypothetical protein
MRPIINILAGAFIILAAIFHAVPEMFFKIYEWLFGRNDDDDDHDDYDGRPVLV